MGGGEIPRERYRIHMELVRSDGRVMSTRSIRVYTALNLQEDGETIAGASAKVAAQELWRDAAYYEKQRLELEDKPKSTEATD